MDEDIVDDVAADELEPASVGGRILALGIDLVCYYGVLFVLYRVVLGFGSGGSNVGVEIAVTFPAFFLVCWLLGRSPGKKLMGLEIVDCASGERPTVGQWVRRVLLFPLIPFLNILFLVPVVLNKPRQALHDMIAGTMVVSTRLF